jgi:CheY-like chemotaxis protein
MLYDCRISLMRANHCPRFFYLSQFFCFITARSLWDPDGYEFIRWVRRLPAAEGGRTPAAALTAFARAEDRQRVLTAGYQAHAVKPIEPAELVRVIASLARRKRAP